MGSWRLLEVVVVKVPYYWPIGVPVEETISAFVQAYGIVGNTQCDDETREPGFEKIAIFVGAAGVPTHAARQLGSGMWTSKLGQGQDIAHTLDGLTGVSYGKVGTILKRQVV